jgi:rhamnosyltransferase
MTEGLAIALVGSRGIPAKYGGAEVFAEELSGRLVHSGFKVYVTCESRRFGEDEYNGVIRLYIPSLQGKTLTVPTLNDFMATLYLLIKCPKIGLIFYLTPDATFAAILPKLLRKKVIVNTDGIEWKRPIIRRPFFSPGWKFISVLASCYLKLTESLALKLANAVTADSRHIKTYLEKKYQTRKVIYIPYGARELVKEDTSPAREKEVLEKHGLRGGEYYFTVGRIVAENNIHRELSGFIKAASDKTIVIVGNFNQKDRYTRYLYGLRDKDRRIKLLPPIFDKEVLGILRKNCYAYIHAYEVGGTNPSLLEQMLCGRPIIAQDNPFHRETLQNGGIYFNTEADLAECINNLEKGKYDLPDMVRQQARRIGEEYNWYRVSRKYSLLFRKLLSPVNNR